MYLVAQALDPVHVSQAPRVGVKEYNGLGSKSAPDCSTRNSMSESLTDSKKCTRVELGLVDLGVKEWSIATVPLKRNTSYEPRSRSRLESLVPTRVSQFRLQFFPV